MRIFKRILGMCEKKERCGMTSKCRTYISSAILAFCLILVPCAQGSNDDFELYRNDQHSFRIKFPKGWKVRDGDGKNVVKKAIHEITGANVNVVVKPNHGGVPDDKEWEALLDAAVSAMKNLDKNAMVLQKGIQYLLNRKALFTKTKLTVRHFDESVELILLSYSVFYKDKVYVLTGGAPVEVFSEMEPMLRAIITSFVIEDFEQVPDQSQSNWNLVSTDADKSTLYYIDNDTISRRPNNVVSVVGKTVYTSESRYHGTYSHIVTSWEFNCGSRQYRAPAIEPHAVDGATIALHPDLEKKLSSMRRNPKEGWKKVPQGSSVENIMKSICLPSDSRKTGQ